MRRFKTHNSEIDKENNIYDVPNANREKIDTRLQVVLKEKHLNIMKEGILRKNYLWYDKDSAIEHY
jgi:hypothetical protein